MLTLIITIFIGLSYTELPIFSPLFAVFNLAYVNDGRKSWLSSILSHPFSTITIWLYCWRKWRQKVTLVQGPLENKVLNKPSFLRHLKKYVHIFIQMLVNLHLYLLCMYIHNSFIHIFLIIFSLLNNF